MIFSSLASTAKGSLQPADIDSNTPCVLMEHIEAHTGVMQSVPFGGLDIRSAKKQFREGDILFGKLRPALRKVAVAEFDGVCSSDIAVFRPHVEPVYYLAAALRGDDVASMLELQQSGASLPRVNVRDILALEIPWPDEPETERLDDIAQTILLSRLAAYRALENCVAIERSLTSA